MFGMFSNCKSLKSVPLFDTSNVKDTSFMFFDCILLKSVLDFNTSSVMEMEHMFDNCESLKYINPYKFKGFDFRTLDNDYLMKQYPELYI